MNERKIYTIVFYINKMCKHLHSSSAKQAYKKEGKRKERKKKKGKEKVNKKVQ